MSDFIKSFAIAFTVAVVATGVQMTVKTIHRNSLIRKHPEAYGL